jgi:hypothetical protein
MGTVSCCPLSEIILDVDRECGAACTIGIEASGDVEVAAAGCDPPPTISAYIGSILASPKILKTSAPTWALVRSRRGTSWRRRAAGAAVDVVLPVVELGVGGEREMEATFVVGSVGCGDADKESCGSMAATKVRGMRVCLLDESYECKQV